MTRLSDQARSSCLLWLVVLTLPVILLASKAGWTMQTPGEIDSFVYTGLIHNPGEILSRYGVTYYANRVMATEPQRLLVSLAGDKWGHLIWQYICLLIVTSFAGILAFRHYGLLAALLSSAWICFSPWYVRSISWDYVDGIAITYLILSFATLVLPRRHERYFHVLAGVILAFACNVNLHSLIFVLGLFPFYFLILRPGLVESFVRLVAGLAGFVIGYGIVVAIQYLQYPPYGFLRDLTSLWIGLGLFGGGMSAFSQPIWSYIAVGHIFVFVPLVVATFLAICCTSNEVGSQRFDVAALGTVVATIVIFLLLHAIGDAVLTSFFYFTYAIPAVTIGVVAIFGSACRTAPQSRLQTSIAVAGAVGIVLCWVFYAAGTLEGVGWSGYLLLAVAAFPLASIKGAPRIVGATIVTPFLTSGLFYTELYYPALHDGVRGAASEELYVDAVTFQKIVSDETACASRTIGFWYANGRLSALDSIQSTYLWGYSRVAGAEAGNPGMPHLSDKETERVARFDCVVLLARSSDEVTQGVMALQNANIQFKAIADKQFGMGTKYFLSIVQITRKPPS